MPIYDRGSIVNMYDQNECVLRPDFLWQARLFAY